MKKITAVIPTCFILFIAVSVACYAGDGEEAGIDWFTLLMGMFGGLALFLAGLDQLADGLKRVAGEALKVMLAKLTTNRIMGALTGAVVTGILNSSSITTVLVVGFVTAGMMTLSQSVGVIMGANIGSTVTAQILAFNVAKYAMLPVAGGFFVMFTCKSDKVKHFGMMIMGLGLVFYGMGLMSGAMTPLREYDPFLNMLQKMNNPALGILAGAVFTGLVQSSAATVGIAIAMASEGLLSLPAGIGLALGANIGTCVTALMAAIGKPPEAVRAAVVHVCFNILGVLAWFFFIDNLANLVSGFSTTNSDLTGMERMAAEVPRQIANANTLFNIINTLVFLPFTVVFARLATFLVPDRKEPVGTITPKFLDDHVVEVPSVALQCARQELARAGDIILEMFEKLEKAISTANQERLRSLVREDDKIDILEEATMDYLSKIRQQRLSESESDEHRALMTTAITLETLADVIETDLVRLASKAYNIKYRSSVETVKLMQEFYLRVFYAVRQMVLVVRDKDEVAARQALLEEENLRRMHNEFIVRKSERLGAITPGALKIARIEVSVVDKLMRIYNLSKRIVLENFPDEKKEEEQAGSDAELELNTAD